MSELRTKVTQTKGGGFLIENPYASTIKFTCGDGSIVEVPELSLRLILTRLYISYTRDVCGIRRSAVTWLNDVFDEKHTYKFWQKAFKENVVHKSLKIISNFLLFLWNNYISFSYIIYTPKVFPNIHLDLKLPYQIL